jgi:hypothetical protein
MRLGREEPMVRELYALYHERRQGTLTPVQREAADKIRQLFSQIQHQQ